MNTLQYTPPAAGSRASNSGHVGLDGSCREGRHEDRRKHVQRQSDGEGDEAQEVKVGPHPQWGGVDVARDDYVPTR